jgi:hypothetical protein
MSDTIITNARARIAEEQRKGSQSKTPEFDALDIQKNERARKLFIAWISGVAEVQPIVALTLEDFAECFELMSRPPIAEFLQEEGKR